MSRFNHEINEPCDRGICIPELSCCFCLRRPFFDHLHHTRNPVCALPLSSQKIERLNQDKKLTTISYLLGNLRHFMIQLLSYMLSLIFTYILTRSILTNIIF